MVLLNLFKVGYYFVSLIAAPVMLPILCLRERGRARLHERFGSWNLRLEDCVWFHGASLGEINGMVPIIESVKRKWPDIPVLVTATSVTGLARASAIADEIRLLPIDHPLWIRRAIRNINPRAFVFGETEIWPSLIQELSKRKVPMYLVNGRISDKSFSSYRLFGPFLRFLFAKLESISVADEISKERFISLGAESRKVSVIGNAKYDLKPSVQSDSEKSDLKASFFKNAFPVLVLGSLRPKEEVHWFPPLARAINSGSKLNVIVAPRHKEKFEHFAEALSRFGIPYNRWSETKNRGIVKDSSDSSVFLLDTLGELESVYSFADVAFIGGTLENFGGHNPLEAAVYGACLVLGPHVQNIRDLSEKLKSKKGAISVEGEHDIEELLHSLVARDKELSEVGRRAQELCKGHQGTGERLAEMIKLS